MATRQELHFYLTNPIKTTDGPHFSPTRVWDDLVSIDWNSLPWRNYIPKPIEGEILRRPANRETPLSIKLDKILSEIK